MSLLYLGTIFCLVNMIFLRLYSYFARRIWLRTCPPPEKKHTTSAPSNHIKSIKSYMGGWVRYNLRILGYIPSHHIRNFIYKHIFLMQLDKKVIIYGGSEIRAPWNIKIGKGTIIGDEAKLDGRNGIIIGKNVNFSTGVWLWTGQHKVNSISFDCINKDEGQIIIKDRAWLGPRTTVLPGKIINEGAVIAAGAVVTKNCEAFKIYAGIPAKPIGQREQNINYEFSGEYLPFF